MSCSVFCLAQFASLSLSTGKAGAINGIILIHSNLTIICDRSRLRGAIKKFCNLAIKNNLLYHTYCHFSTYSPATSMLLLTFILSCLCPENRFFNARHNASAVYAIALCPSVSVSVCLPQVGVLLKWLNTGSHK